MASHRRPGQRSMSMPSASASSPLEARVTASGTEFETGWTRSLTKRGRERILCCGLWGRRGPQRSKALLAACPRQATGTVRLYDARGGGTRQGLTASTVEPVHPAAGFVLHR